MVAAVRRDVVTIWYARCPKCRSAFIGTTERQAKFRLAEHMQHKHGLRVDANSVEAKSVDVELK